MKLCVLSVVLALVGVGPGLSAAPPKKEAKREYSKVEVVGTVGRGYEPEPTFGLKPAFSTRTFYTIKVDGGERRLALDEAAGTILGKNVGKQVTITGSFRGQAIRVKTLNGLDVD